MPASIDMFLDGKGAKAREAVHILYASEKVRPDALASSPDVSDADSSPGGFQVIGLQSLVMMKLTSYRLKDRVHLQDMISVGLIDETWPARFPRPSASASKRSSTIRMVDDIGLDGVRGLPPSTHVDGSRLPRRKSLDCRAAMIAHHAQPRAIDVSRWWKCEARHPK